VTPLWRRPIWLLGHLVALVAVLAFVRAGIWQIDRLHEKQARNRIIAARSDGPAIPLEQVRLDAAEYQRVRVDGRFDAADEVKVRNRAFEGTNGYHVLTPLVLGNGTALLVNRGWIGLDDVAPAPPPGQVSVEGLLLKTQERHIGPKDPPTGKLPILNRVDVQRVQQQLDRKLYPLFLQMTAPAPPKNQLPNIIDLPARDEGPHRSYAIQWFLFTGVVLVGYPLLLKRRIEQERASSQEGEAAVHGEDLPGDVAGVAGQQEHD
jgi:cytochrome oxidase assembly protein ShyY1